MKKLFLLGIFSLLVLGIVLVGCQLKTTGEARRISEEELEKINKMGYAELKEWYDILRAELDNIIRVEKMYDTSLWEPVKEDMPDWFKKLREDEVKRQQELKKRTDHILAQMNEISRRMQELKRQNMLQERYGERLEEMDIVERINQLLERRETLEGKDLYYNSEHIIALLEELKRRRKTVEPEQEDLPPSPTGIEGRHV